MSVRLILSGLSSTSFFTLTREIIEEDHNNYIIKTVPYFPRLGETWIEHIISDEVQESEVIYILGSLNCMLDKYDLLYLIQRYNKVVLVPGKICMNKIRKMYLPSKERIFVTSTSGNYKQYLSQKTLFKLWLIMSYLYIEKPEELKKLSEELTVLELDLNSIVTSTFQKYYREAINTLESLKHKLLYEKQYNSIEIRNGNYISVSEKYLPILPALTRLLSLDADKFIITKYIKQENPYAYLVLSFPKNHSGKDMMSKFGASMIKTLLLSRQNRVMRKAIKASVAGTNMLEIIIEKKYIDDITERLVDILSLIGGNMYSETRQVIMTH